MKLGLKLWSRNENYIQPALDLYQKKVFDYIELFTVPGSASYIEKWEKLDIPFVLHASHSLAGFNPSIETRKEANFSLLPEVEQFRCALNPEYIIFHPGLDGSIDETIRQFCEIRKQFPEIHKLAIVENKPKVGLNAERCVGAAPQEISRVIEEADMGFCFDVGHAIGAANSAGIEPHVLIRDFLQLSPNMFHLSDGDGESELDAHLNFGSGNFGIAGILKLLPDDGMVTIETDKSSLEDLGDFSRDVEYLNHLLDF